MAPECDCCEDLAPQAEGSVSRTYNEVAQAAARGCGGCRLIMHAVNDCVPESLIADQNGEVLTSISVKQAIMRNFVELAVRWGKDAIVVLDLLVEENSFTPWSSIRSGRATSGDSLSTHSFTLVQKWLNDCLQNHVSCFGIESTLPSRVLDLDVISPNLRLCESGETEAAYVCLSHCWGDSRGIVATENNLQQLMNQINFGYLPKTFQDAVSFTRKLGIRYLWLDSLCIVQDSEKDWLKESAKMAMIYANSHVTIAATRSSSDDGGMFFKHINSSVKGLHWTGHEYEVHVRPVIDHMDEAQFPLLRRAWIYQERLLAPRVIHFGKQELWWECLQCVACECGGIFGERYATGQEKIFSKKTHNEALSQSNLDAIRRRWHEIVEEYSQLALSKPRDKLPALSGIAQQVQKQRQGVYLAGLWTDTLIEDLLWYRRDATDATFTEKYRAPSWSWAALEGSVRYFDAPTIKESSVPVISATAEIESLQFKYISVIERASRSLSENTFGEVLSGHVILRGPIVPVQIFDSRAMSSNTLQRRRRSLRKQRLRSMHYEFRFERSDSTCSYSFFADYDLQKRDATFAEADYAAIRVGTDGSGDEYAILLKCIHREQGICERVGLFTTKFSRWQNIEHMEVFGDAFAGEDVVADFTVI